MKMTINRESLLDALGAPASLASGAGAAYLACVLVDARADGATVEGTNLCESARCEAAALVEEPGRALVPARMLSDVVKSLPSAAVTLEGGDGQVEVTCGKASFEVPALDPGDFPTFPVVDAVEEVRVGVAQLKAAVGTCRQFAADAKSKSDVLKGVHVSARGGSLTAVATDSYRVARIAAECGDGAFEGTLPSALADIAAGLKCGGEAVLSRSDRQVMLTSAAGAFTSRAVEGTFPDVGRFFGGETSSLAVLKASDLAGAAKRALAVGGSKPAVLTFGESLRVERSGGEAGSYAEDVECSESRGSAEVGVSALYLRDALSAVSGDEVSIGVDDPVKPIVMRSGAVEVMVMPVRLVRS